MCSYVRSEADHYSLAVSNPYNILKKTTSVRAAMCSYVRSEADHYSLTVSNPYIILKKTTCVRAAMCSYVRSQADHYSLAVSNPYNILKKLLPFEQPCVHMCVQRLTIIRWPSLILTIS